MSGRMTLISDFNIEPLSQMLRNAELEPGLEIRTAPFGQVEATLWQPPVEAVDIGVIWARAENVLPTVNRALNLEAVDHDVCLQEVDHFAEGIKNFGAQTRYCFVVSWTLPSHVRGYGILDWKSGLGLRNLLAKLNVRLAEQLGDQPNLHILDGERWFAAATDPFAAKLWYATKVPYTGEIFRNATQDLVSAYQALNGKSRKLIVVDLDDTLWGGIVGEVGWEKLRIGGHDHVGEAFLDFQKTLKALRHRGVQLAVVSKNEESTALAAISDNPEMLLRLDDFVGWRINWADKAANIASLADEVGLGLSSIVFIDDNPAERQRVRDALPDVLVPEWPKDPTRYATTLSAMSCFDTAAVTSEDRVRGDMYAADRHRRNEKTAVGSVDDWLKRLETAVTVEPVGPENLARAAQLLNKTNQMNMATRRMSSEELMEWAARPENRMFALRVSDKFGALGLCGLIGLTVDETQTAYLSDFVLSCRVMGRRIEDLMLSIAVEEARGRGAQRLQALYLPTERNVPCLKILRASPLDEPQEHLFAWDCAQSLTRPDSLILHDERGAA